MFSPVISDQRYDVGKRTRAWIFTGALALLTGCVGGTGAPPDSGETADPKSRKNLPEWAQRVGELSDRLDQSEQNHRTVLADLNNRLALMERQLGTLQGSVEEVRHEGKRLNERIELIPPPESKTAPAPAAVPTIESAPATSAATTAAAAQPATTPRPGLPATPAATTPAATTPAPGATTPAAAATTTAAVKPPAAAPATPAAPTAATPTNPGEAYDAAMHLLKQKQFDAARNAFQNFLKANPKDARADNAQYWIGELYLVQRQLPEALTAFNQVLVKWPESPKVPDSLLKIGYTFQDLNDLDNAQKTLQRLIKEYPNSSPAAVAKPRLEEIKKKTGR
ncbi:MAG: tol-pal system protein YbgF [Magnetococcales bacterium]|nr:tol-pal system protein YbgF [Magnetococcales bacterium]NGZ05806.1 tol-pal system protein YbgF [Magnetococcales bacterium]